MLTVHKTLVMAWHVLKIYFHFSHQLTTILESTIYNANSNLPKLRESSQLFFGSLHGLPIYFPNSTKVHL